MDEVQRLLAAIYNDDIGFVFGAAILALFIFSVFRVNTEDSRQKIIVSNAPATMTSLGILGTFFGIFLGLLDFEISNINKSVPELLDGLKVAFGSSIMGIAAAVAFRAIKPFIQNQAVEEDAGIEQIVEELRVSRLENADLIKEMTIRLEQRISENNSILQRMLESTDDKLERIGLATDNVAGHVQATRENLDAEHVRQQERYDAFTARFNELAENFSEAFSEALIEELRNVIREFNDRITEQFGENFAQLNEAVGRLVDWQENYRTQLDELRVLYENAVAGIEQANQSLQAIQQSSESIPENMETLRQTVDGFATQNEELGQRLEAFAEMRENAVNAFPVIEENLQTITSGMRESAEQFEGLGQHAEQAITAIRDQISQSISDSEQAQQEMLDRTRESFNEAVGQATQQMQQAIETLDESMQEEIGRIVTAMAENLSGITQQFVNDYEPLMQASRDLIETAQAARNDA